ncbi:hypothetical protein IV203_001238 [Nitzschia inconspicua]|uniref:Uncharacterized protein n=1 Tax=Nitzschia inconspicua TaxID=303405 RepID=A0A9K3L6R0_9STRA|nr:hypothetical protein IV203_001238 [Nitzschia inconspicua]
MTSKIVSLAKILYTRGALGKTATVPSTWAVLRRVVETGDREPEDERHVEDVPLRALAEESEVDVVVEQILDENAPIASEFAKSELHRFSRDFFRSILTPIAQQREQEDASMPRSTLADAIHTSRSEDHRRIVEEPDLRVPVGDVFVPLAQ